MLKDNLSRKRMLNIVCLGDSITYGYRATVKRGEQVDMDYPKVLKKMLRQKYEYDFINVVNSGDPGWQVRQALKNLDSKVFSHKPDLCVIMYGINDSRGSFNGGLPRSEKQFYDEYNKLILQLKNKGIEVIIMTPNYAKVRRLSKFCEIIKQIGIEQNIQVVDNYILFEEIVNINGVKSILPDKIHLRDDLYEIIAYNLMKEIINEQ